MTNEEKYKDEILDIAKNWNRVAVYKGKPCACESISCPVCDFHRGSEDCTTSLQEWLNAEYLEEQSNNNTKSPCCDCKSDMAFCCGCPKYFEWKKQNS